VSLEFSILLRLLVSAILGGLVGYEREQTHKRAGLRTHMLVAVGATLFVSCNDLALEQSRGLEDSKAAVLQVQVALLSPVQAVATGIGFLGAGTIFFSQNRNRVQGLTTAASIWVISAIGLAVGFDRYLLATGATILVLVILHVLVRLEQQNGAGHLSDEGQPGQSPSS
jgi:putative Mg2+ transporter-C (MgtC) family protein